MKNPCFFVILLILLMLSVSILFSQSDFFNKFDYYCITSDFNGSAYNGNVILVYGNNGVILRSEDGGSLWQNTQLSESYNIVSMVNLNRDFYGVTSNGWVIKSTDNGRNWLEYNVSDTAYRLLLYKQKLYYCSNKGIIVLQPDLQKIGEYPLELDTPYYSFTIFRDKIIYSAGVGKFRIVSLSDSSSSILDLTEIGICDTCVVPKIICSDENVIFFALDSGIFMYDGSNIIKLIKPVEKSAPFALYNGELFEIFSKFNPVAGVDSLFFLKVDYANNRNVKINYGKNDRYIRDLHFVHLNFLSLDTLIAVGRNKLIYMSFDGGLNWVLRSYYLPSLPHRFGSKYAFDIGPYAQIFSTKDAGITWLPQRNFDPRFSQGAFDYNFNQWISYIDSLLCLIYVYSKYETENFAYTNDGGDNVYLKKVIELVGYIPENGIGEPFPTCSYQNRIIFCFPGVVNENWKYTIILIMNKDLEVEKRVVLDSVKIQFISSYENDAIIAIAENHKYDDKRIVLLESKDQGSTWSELLELSYLAPGDMGEARYPFKLIGNYLFSFFVHNGTYYAYLVDLKSLGYEQLFASDSISIASAILFENKMILSGIKNNFKELVFLPFVIESEISSQPKEWIDMTPTSKDNIVYYHLDQEETEDYKAISIVGYDKRLKIKAVWFADRKKINSIEDSFDTIDNIFISNPLPNPSNDFVVLQIRATQTLMLDINSIKILNVLGEVIQNQDLEFVQFDSYSGEIVWKIKNVPSGVYFLAISIRNYYVRTVPMVIYR